MATRIINRPSIKIEVKDGKYKPFIFDNGKKRYLCDSDEPEPEPVIPTDRILYTVVAGGTKPESTWITNNCSENVFDESTGKGYLVLNEDVNTLDADSEDNSIFNDSGDSNIAGVIIPSQITTLGLGAFAHCTNLISAIIPNSVSSIGESVFKDCTSLASVACLATTPPILGEDVFANINTTTCGVPEASISAYQNNPSWSAVFTTFVKAIPENPEK